MPNDQPDWVSANTKQLTTYGVNGLVADVRNVTFDLTARGVLIITSGATTKVDAKGVTTGILYITDRTSEALGNLYLAVMAQSVDTQLQISVTAGAGNITVWVFEALDLVGVQARLYDAYGTAIKAVASFQGPAVPVALDAQQAPFPINVSQGRESRPANTTSFAVNPTAAGAWTDSGARIVGGKVLYGFSWGGTSSAAAARTRLGCRLRGLTSGVVVYIGFKFHGANFASVSSDQQFAIPRTGVDFGFINTENVAIEVFSDDAVSAATGYVETN